MILCDISPPVIQDTTYTNMCINILNNMLECGLVSNQERCCRAPPPPLQNKNNKYDYLIMVVVFLDSFLRFLHNNL